MAHLFMISGLQRSLCLQSGIAEIRIVLRVVFMLVTLSSSLSILPLVLESVLQCLCIAAVRVHCVRCVLFVVGVTFHSADVPSR